MYGKSARASTAGDAMPDGSPPRTKGGEDSCLLKYCI